MKKVIVVDTETGGLDPKNVDILTIGIVPIINGQIQKGQEFKVQGSRVDPRAMEINKIDLVEHNKVAVSRAEAFTQVSEYIESIFPEKDYILVGHNVIFDINFLGQIDPEKKLFSERNIVDTKALTLWFREQGHLPAKQSTSLQAIKDLMNIYVEGDAHSSLPDAEVTAQLYMIYCHRIHQMSQAFIAQREQEFNPEPVDNFMN